MRNGYMQGGRMKTIVLLLLASTLRPPLAAQRVEQQLVAARDTVWRAFFHNDTALLRRYIPPAAATAEGSMEMRWSTRNDILASAARFAKAKSRFVDVRFSNTQFSTSGHSALVQSNYEVITEAIGGARRDTRRGRATELFVRM